MTTFNFGRNNKSYAIQVYYWAKRLGADECTIHTDNSVTLDCKDGNICDHFKPTASELSHKSNGIDIHTARIFDAEF